MAQIRFASHNSPGEAIMLGECPNQQRSATRKFLRLPAWMVFYGVSFQKHVAMVRDMTRQGIFFYSDVRPQLGEEMAFVMKFPKWTQSSPIACKGKVVRVEQAVPGAATGVALSLTRFFVLNKSWTIRAA
ncbi:MAG: hypothetical protein DMG74_18035 [Acidobacteria bacterium]|nr:MAG: hypothetical protein DMG74_18035 [Acidobacteriota bacterium]